MDRFLTEHDNHSEHTRFTGALLHEPRSIVQAFAEFEELRRNAYNYRPRRSLVEGDIPMCKCTAQAFECLTCEIGCENRSMQVECVAGKCTTKVVCSNQRFQQGRPLQLSLAHCGSKGVGLVAEQYIPKDAFILEYTGEVVKREEKAVEIPRHYYGVQINDREIIDATHQGSLARFANHSCDPNCTLERWNVNGEICCGLFAASPIERGTELTFYYAGTQMEEERSRKCMCRRKGCRGLLPL
ncbi:hypothetical protein DVH05_019370 [Phytophthora capsici]|nr:hypothetical protein DVH05_019370 [Phytophthora capsici]